MLPRRRRARATSDLAPLDGRHGDALAAALALLAPERISVTVYLCWHEGRGHGYPLETMQAAARLRDRHAAAGRTGSQYIALTFTPSHDDFADLVLVAPHCDLAYATDAGGATWCSLCRVRMSVAARGAERCDAGPVSTPRELDLGPARARRAGDGGAPCDEPRPDAAHGTLLAPSAVQRVSGTAVTTGAPTPLAVEQACSELDLGPVNARCAGRLGP